MDQRLPARASEELTHLCEREVNIGAGMLNGSFLDSLREDTRATEVCLEMSIQT